MAKVLMDLHLQVMEQVDPEVLEEVAAVQHQVLLMLEMEDLMVVVEEDNSVVRVIHMEHVVLFVLYGQVVPEHSHQHLSVRHNKYTIFT